MMPNPDDSFESCVSIPIENCEEVKMDTDGTNVTAVDPTKCY